MVEILERGRKKDPQHKVTCSGCSSKLRFCESEAAVQIDRNERVLVITCPVCYRQIYKSKDAT